MLLNAGWMLGGKGVGAVLSTLYLAMATRSLGLEGFGQFALVLGLAQGIAGVANFQSWQVVVRYGMEHLHGGRREALTRLVRFSAALDVVSGLVGTLLVTAAILLAGPHFGWTADFTAQALWTSIILVLAVYSTPIGILRLHDRFGDATLAETLMPIVRFIGALVAWAVSPTVVAFLIAWTSAQVVTAVAYWLIAARFERVGWIGRWIDWGRVSSENAGILGYAWTTNLTSALGVGGKQLAVLIVGFLVTPAAAGGFRVAQQLSQALGKLSQTLSRAIFPELMRSRAGEAGGFEELFARTQRMALIGGFVVVIVLLTVGRPLLGLIAGDEFLPVYPILLVLGIAAAIDFAAIGFEPALAAKGQAGTAFRLRLIATIVMLGLMVGLTPRFDGMGAAAAVLVSSILSYIMLGQALRR